MQLSCPWEVALEITVLGQLAPKALKARRGDEGEHIGTPPFLSCGGSSLERRHPGRKNIVQPLHGHFLQVLILFVFQGIHSLTLPVSSNETVSPAFTFSPSISHFLSYPSGFPYSLRLPLPCSSSDISSPPSLKNSSVFLPFLLAAFIPFFLTKKV